MPTILGKLAQGRQPLVKILISNAFGVPEDSAPMQRAKTMWALIDTGATGSALEAQLCRELLLIQQGTSELYGAGSETSTFVPRYGASVSLYTDHRENKREEWPDVISFAGMNMPNRPFQAVLGMDIIMRGKLTIENNGQAIRFEF